MMRYVLHVPVHPDNRIRAISSDVVMVVTISAWLRANGESDAGHVPEELQPPGLGGGRTASKGKREISQQITGHIHSFDYVSTFSE